MSEALQRRYIFPTEQISKDISQFSMGFVRLRVDGQEQNAECAGSGTFVSVGSVEGILTAAHVVNALPEAGEIGICLPTSGPKQFAAHTIPMELLSSIVIGTEPFGPLGPDLAFLRPPPHSIGSLKAKASFFNLSKRRADVLANKMLSKNESDVLCGLIHELTEILPPNGNPVKKTQFSSLFGPSRLASVRYVDPHNLLYYEPSGEFDFKLPQNFEGMSGGGVWRLFINNRGNEIEIIDRSLIGVIFQ